MVVINDIYFVERYGLRELKNFMLPSFGKVNNSCMPDILYIPT